MSTRALTWRGSGAELWAGAAGIGGLLALGAAFFPLPALIVSLSLTASVLLVRSLGLQLGLWCLFVGTIPLRQAMSVDMVGTVTLFANDVLLVGLTGLILVERGLREIWRESWPFRLGCVLVVIGIAGLYTATRLFWGIAIMMTVGGQLGAFFVAWHLVRTARAARLTLLAFVIGLVPAAAVGFHQTTLDVEEFEAENWSIPAIAWDEAGNPRIRAFGTYDHPLRYSHSLSVGAGVALGLALTSRTLLARLALLALTALIAYANQYTYSVGGVLGTAAGLVAALLVMGNRWLPALLPLGLAVWIVVTPATFLKRIERVVTGESSSAAARIITYHQTARVLAEHPLTGVGWGSIRTTLEHEHRISRVEAVAFTAENYFLLRGLAHGLPGIALVVWLFILFLRNVFSRPPPGQTTDWPRVALIAAGAAFFVQGQFIPSGDATSRYTLWVLFALAERMRMDHELRRGT